MDKGEGGHNLMGGCGLFHLARMIVEEKHCRGGEKKCGVALH